MVAHEIIARGVDLTGATSSAPVLVHVHAEDFPARLLRDLATRATPRLSSATVITGSGSTLYQPVQRVLPVAFAKLSCVSPGMPRVDPTRVVSAGIVVRRIARQNGIDRPDRLEAWLRAPDGRFAWSAVHGEAELLDPDPAKRPTPSSGRAELDAQLAAIAIASASTESTSPAFLAPPDTCATLGETVAYGVVPTASSETTDGTPAQTTTPGTLAANLPALLRAGATVTPLPGQAVDFRWMSDEFLSALFPPPSPGTSDPRIAAFGTFANALRMLKSTFGAFDGTPHGDAILRVLENYRVDTRADGAASESMASFYRRAAHVLLDAVPGGAPATVTLPYRWDALDAAGAAALANAMLAALAPRTQAIVPPRARYQNPARLYRLRMFFRVKSEHANCPPVLVWSAYSAPFRIAAWYENADRPQPPVPLPDPTQRDFLNALKPNCSFVVPANLMGAMQGTSMSGLMNGSAGGSNLSLNWICGFNIPLITICAFFVLNIFLGLLNIVFFWLPMIKICIPFPEEE